MKNKGIKLPVPFICPLYLIETANIQKGFDREKLEELFKEITNRKERNKNIVKAYNQGYS